MTTNTVVKNGVAGILVPLSFFSSESVNPVLINTQVAVYTDNRDAVIDASGIKNWILSFQEQAQHDNQAINGYEFLQAFHEEYSEKYSKISLLLGYNYRQRTFPVSIGIEFDGSKFKSTTQVAYVNQENRQTIDAKLFSNKVLWWDTIADTLILTAEHLEAEFVNLPDVAIVTKGKLLSKEFPNVDRIEILVSKQGKICMIEA